MMLTKKINNIVYVFFAITTLISCKIDHSSNILFQEVENTIGKSNFKKEKGTLKVDSKYDFESYSFEFNQNKKKVYGYWGVINDTLYFINPLVNREKCIVKFPIFYFNSSSKMINVEPISNCDDIPIMVQSYKIEVTKEENNLYYLKHSVNEVHSINTDYCTFIFSREKGIIDFNQ